jgi:hypothetical protein
MGHTVLVNFQGFDLKTGQVSKSSYIYIYIYIYIHTHTHARTQTREGFDLRTGKVNKSFLYAHTHMGLCIACIREFPS